jgi:hypothetical protein
MHIMQNAAAVRKSNSGALRATYSLWLSWFKGAYLTTLSKTIVVRLAIGWMARDEIPSR